MKCNKTVQSVYMGYDMLRVLQESATNNGRSLSAEICYRLRQTLKK